ncbi:hypothetical protein M9H77_30201 [Catharanthus roseus]|uniref:Uncharacterized protein n=1 Tax=Catharanthus roseus TaxID=4058 RepID=A0ACB9ZXE7_CATRO|nr:hypothetical protein M9H77_30201 [Catharanthus roseus]
MEDDICHVQQTLKGLEQQLSRLAKGVKELKREEEAIFEQNSRRDFDFEQEIVMMIYLIKGNYVNMDERFHKRRDDYEGYYDSYNYGGYNYRRISQIWELHQDLLVTTS